MNDIFNLVEQQSECVRWLTAATTTVVEPTKSYAACYNYSNTGRGIQARVLSRDAKNIAFDVDHDVCQNNFFFLTVKDCAEGVPSCNI